MPEKNHELEQPRLYTVTLGRVTVI
ncbi:hypothetical protein LCGC14_1212030, partial [marine sediment metagenome]